MLKIKYKVNKYDNEYYAFSYMNFLFIVKGAWIIDSYHENRKVNKNDFKKMCGNANTIFMNYYLEKVSYILYIKNR